MVVKKAVSSVDERVDPRDFERVVLTVVASESERVESSAV